MPTGGIISSLWGAATGGSAAGISAAGVTAEAGAVGAAASLATALTPKQLPKAPVVPNPVSLPNPIAQQQNAITQAALASNQSGRQSTILTNPLGSGGSATLLGGA